MNFTPPNPIAEPSHMPQFGQVCRVQTRIGIARGIVVVPPPILGEPMAAKVRWFEQPGGPGDYYSGADRCDTLCWDEHSGIFYEEDGPPKELGPTHYIALAGKPPLALQWAPYLTDAGDLYPGIITVVGGASPDGKYVNVAMRWFKPTKLAEHMGADFYGGWLYNVSTGQVYWQPCAPPWP